MVVRKLGSVLALIVFIGLSFPSVAMENSNPKPPVLPGNILSTPAFTLAFPETWQARRITKGMVSAGTLPDASPQASADVYYYVLPQNASDRAVKRFRERQKKHSVKSYIDKREAKKARWKSKFTTVALENETKAEQFDMEILQRSPAFKKKKTPVCRFFRLYHAPRAEVHVTYSHRGACKDTRDNFDSFISGLKWN